MRTPLALPIGSKQLRSERLPAQWTDRQQFADYSVPFWTLLDGAAQADGLTKRAYDPSNRIALMVRSNPRMLSRRLKL